MTENNGTQGAIKKNPVGLEPCPCGHIPAKLVVQVPQGGKYGQATGDCSSFAMDTRPTTVSPWRVRPTRGTRHSAASTCRRRRKVMARKPDRLLLWLLLALVGGAALFGLAYLYVMGLQFDP